MVAALYVLKRLGPSSGKDFLHLDFRRIKSNHKSKHEDTLTRGEMGLNKLFYFKQILDCKE